MYAPTGPARSTRRLPRTGWSPSIGVSGEADALHARCNHGYRSQGVASAGPLCPRRQALTASSRSPNAKRSGGRGAATGTAAGCAALGVVAPTRPQVGVPALCFVAGLPVVWPGRAGVGSWPACCVPGGVVGGQLAVPVAVATAQQRSSSARRGRVSPNRTVSHARVAGLEQAEQRSPRASGQLPDCDEDSTCALGLGFPWEEAVQDPG